MRAAPGNLERGDILSPVSKAQQKAVAKYNAKTYDRIEVKVPKGKKEVIQDCALAAGKSLNESVATAIDERMERDSAAPDSESSG
jgi:predicted HicB family RNase H-like nuclease